MADAAEEMGRQPEGGSGVAQGADVGFGELVVEVGEDTGNSEHTFMLQETNFHADTKEGSNLTEADREKIKLRASYLNGIAIVLLALGGLGPAFALLNTFEWHNFLLALFSVFTGGMSSWELHQLAQRQLDRLAQPELTDLDI